MAFAFQSIQILPMGGLKVIVRDTFFSWIFGSLKLTHAMPFMVCLTFGALISATDPVTVLALFNVSL